MNASVVSSWTSVFGKIPENYLVFDLETTGLDIENDFILQIGCVEIRNKEKYSEDSVVLDWSLSRHKTDVLARMEKTAYHMESRGVTFHWTKDRLKDEGKSPEDSLAYFFSRWLSVSPAFFLVGHNSWRYDYPMLSTQLNKHLGITWNIDPNGMLDTGAFVKSLQTGIVPHHKETMRDFTTRCILQGPRARWSLDRVCPDLFGWTDFDPSAAHDAVYDSYWTHRVLEECRNLLHT